MAQPTPDFPKAGLIPPEAAEKFMSEMAEAAAQLKQTVAEWRPSDFDEQGQSHGDLRASHERLLAIVRSVTDHLDKALVLAIEQSVPIPLDLFDVDPEEDPEITAMMVEFDRSMAAFNALFARVQERLAGQSKAPLSQGQGPFAPESISFINAPMVIAAMRSMWAGQDYWQRPEGAQPYDTDKVGVSVYFQDSAQFNPLAPDLAWQRVLSLDDSKVNTFLICLGKWLADTGDGAQGLTKTRVHIADVLSFRGVKKHHSGGYRRAQKEEAKQDILALNSIWVRSVEKIFTGRGKSELRAIDSRLLEVAIESNPDIFGGFEPFAFRIAPGDWAAHYLTKHNRYIATLLRPVMRYDPDKQRITMRLGIYIATQWRNRAHNESYEQPWKVSSMLGGASIARPANNFERFRQQFEQALDRLQEDKVIAGWEYVRDTELPQRKWFDHWLEWRVKITPSELAIERYEKIPERRQALIARAKQASKAATKRKASA